MPGRTNSDPEGSLQWLAALLSCSATPQLCKHAAVWQVLAGVLRGAAQPFLRQVCAWVFEGRLHRAPGDFFVRQAAPGPAADRAAAQGEERLAATLALHLREHRQVPLRGPLWRGRASLARQGAAWCMSAHGQMAHQACKLQGCASQGSQWQQQQQQQQQPYLLSVCKSCTQVWVSLRHCWCSESGLWLQGPQPSTCGVTHMCWTML